MYNYYHSAETARIDGFFHLMAIWSLIAIIALGIVWYDQSRIEDYDDSEYHYIMREMRKLDLEIEAYEAQLLESQEFTHRLIEFYRQHKEYLDEREYYPDRSSGNSSGGS